MLSYIIMNFLFFIIITILRIAFYTLIERKLLRLLQTRSGPKFNRFIGTLQPIFDAVKLGSKESDKMESFRFKIFRICPLLILFISLRYWLICPIATTRIFYTFFFFLAILGVRVYPSLVGGWSSNSRYSLLGCIRRVAQSVSYEAVLSLLLIRYMININTTSFTTINNSISTITQALTFKVLLGLIWVFCILAEMNRPPFDFSEGESELVSGFNTEYQGFFFSFFFIAEYLMMVFISIISCIIWVGCSINWVMTIFISLGFILLFVIVRGVVPRYRYDLLMYIAWGPFMILVLYSLTQIILLTSLIELMWR